MYEGGVSAATKPCGAVTGLDRDGRRRAPASVHAWTKEWVPAAATPHGAMTGQAHEGGRHALASVDGEGALAAATPRRAVSGLA
jgi:hypothetical protein